ncbi:PREDICTED: transmembrane protein 245-like [Priapulus caudatus]|uniref:Transmembrane protein 245-like n=1 Tax=Priapulus caudatus TaxID=37621 RepID=A0ABM1E0S7_PRICU|nr:PREDICTED: transmembrane protein 245-like [Priapulus caudatus]
MAASVERPKFVDRHIGWRSVAAAICLICRIIDRVSEVIGGTILQHLKHILLAALAIIGLYLLYYIASVTYLLSVGQAIFGFVYDALGYFSALWVWTLVIAYVLVVIFYWNKASSNILRHVSLVVWIAVLFHLATIAGAYRVPLFIFLVTLLVVGFVTELRDATTTVDDEGNRRMIWKKLQLEGSNVGPTPICVGGSSSNATSKVPETLRAVWEAVTTQPEKEAEREQKAETEAADSDDENVVEVSSGEQQEAGEVVERSTVETCFLAVFWGLLLAQLWRHLWVVYLLPIPVTIVAVKRIGSYFELWSCIQKKLGCLRDRLHEWVDERKDGLMPKPIRGLTKMLVKGDKKVIEGLYSMVDQYMSIVSIAVLFIVTTLGTILLAFQVHSESVHLVTVTGTFLNETVQRQPSLSQWLPERSEMEKHMESAVDSAYVHGRQWIATNVHSLMSQHGKEEMDVAKIEDAILQIWDKLYESWVTRDQSVGWRAPRGVTLVVRWVLESVWVVIMNNINILLGSVTSVVSLVLGGGTALLNILLSVMVFFTTLLILLSASGDVYLPVAWFGRLSPGGESGGSSKIGEAVKEAISGVFMASMKMCAFYFLYTWLTHTIFGINIVFIPAVMAAVFAAIPFLGTYIAAVPAALELWLVHGQPVHAALLILLHFVPSSIVDPAIYSEIKGGGHPYLTGLAIVGGMTCYGLEGAIIGPILLCLLIVAFNVYSTMQRDAKNIS